MASLIRNKKLEFGKKNTLRGLLNGVVLVSKRVENRYVMRNKKLNISLLNINMLAHLNQTKLCEEAWKRSITFSNSIPNKNEKYNKNDYNEKCMFLKIR